MQKRSCRHCRHVICLTQHRMLKRIKSLRSLRGCAATSKAKDARCQSQPLWCLWPIPNLQRSVTPITRDIKVMQHPICKRQALYGQVNANGYDGARQKRPPPLLCAKSIIPGNWGRLWRFCHRSRLHWALQSARLLDESLQMRCTRSAVRDELGGEGGNNDVQPVALFIAFQA